ncbi:hypothetical protein ABEB36_014111 [Hypothenemus hampei]|uniref:Uncharacterized protein n=1 Tax=Hypothenemus hampei TaxID=57062 RepID=A0ABD1E3B5_HYPHA
MTQNRKRSRSVHDETEFMPLSKRINNLHINNMLNDHNSRLAFTEWCQTSSNHQQQTFPESPGDSDQSIDWSVNPQYSPDLNESQNPHYFSINKLLYEMYIERMSRGCHQI